MTNKQKKRKERNDKILLLYKQNKPIPYIVEACNVSRETVYRIMRDVKRPSKSQLKVMRTIEENNEYIELFKARQENCRIEAINEIRSFILNAEYGDVLSVQHFIKDLKTSLDDNDKIKKITSYVYLMKNNRNGYIKIGYTNREPKYRERTLQSEDPDITLIHHQKGCNLADEKTLHKKYKDKRLRGEWFNLNDSDVEDITNYLRTLDSSRKELINE